jgi:hypothetical protein
MRVRVFLLLLLPLLACPAAPVCSNIGFVAANAEPGIVVFYSCMQFAVGSVSGGVALYQGYRGIAGDLARSSRIYLIAQGILTALMLVFCAISSGNVHGFAGIGAHKDDRPQCVLLRKQSFSADSNHAFAGSRARPCRSDALRSLLVLCAAPLCSSRPAYMVLCILEGLFWLVCAVVSLVGMYRVWKYPGHERATRDATAAAEANAKASARADRPRKSKRAREATDASAAGDEEAPRPARSSKSKQKGKSRPPPEEDPV